MVENYESVCGSYSRVKTGDRATRNTVSHDVAAVMCNGYLFYLTLIRQARPV